MSDISKYLLSKNQRPEWLNYPPELVEMVQAGFVDLPPWHLCKADSVITWMSDLKQRLGRDLAPFAYRQDREDIACFEKGRGESVLIIHDNTEPGWENEDSYARFTEWRHQAELEAAHWRKA